MDLPSCNRDFVLQTPRLLLREMTQQDLPDLEEMLLDPAVMYAYEHTFGTASAFGPWCIAEPAKW